jgi:hypothetical protein
MPKSYTRGKIASLKNDAEKTDIHMQKMKTRPISLTLYKIN